MKLGRLFIGASRTNETACRRFSIASWEYVTGYWRWALYWSPPKGWREVFRLPRIGPCKNCGTEWFGHWGITSFSGWAVFPFIGSISLHTQPPMEAMKTRNKKAHP